MHVKIMKKLDRYILLGCLLISKIYAAGSYVEDFERYGTLNFSGGQASMSDGAIIKASDSSAINIYQNSSSWKALRMAQDGTRNTISTYIIGPIEQGDRVNNFTASFDIQFKNVSDYPADRFSFNFGNLTGLLPRDGENGLWSAGQAGSMLSVVWDFYYNHDISGEFIGSGINGGIEVYKNGSLLSGSQVDNPAKVFGSIQNTFTRFNIQYNEELNGSQLILNYGGTVDLGGNIVGGSNLYTLTNLGLSFSVGDKFAMSSSTGGSDMDVFVDNVAISTVPEPSALLLLAVGLGVVLRRRRRTV